MRFWNNELRICPKCKTPVEMPEEARTECPKCKVTVWFFNYRVIEPPPDVPPPRATALLDNPTTTLLLATTAILGLVALVAFFNETVSTLASALAAIGFAVFGFMRHAETRRIEAQLEHITRVLRYAETMRDRGRELAARYCALLQTGNMRIEHYFNDIYLRAEREREEAARHRDLAHADRKAIGTVETRILAMAQRLIDDHLKWTTQKLRPDPENYQRRKLDLEKAFEFVESIGYSVPSGLRDNALARLKSDYKEVVRQHTLREEQKRLNQQMREEERLQREADRAVQEAEQKEREVQRRLDQILRDHKGVFDAEVEELKRQLAEAQARAERAKSMAELTKVGHVYILSNIGSFGDDVYKVGMTRRVDPDDRVRELGDASVPFPFDVHAMIFCENAPALEHALHRELAAYRVNRVNLRKEFFHVSLATIIDVVRRHHGEVAYIAEPEALQYRETQNITPDEVVEIESELE